MHKIKIVYTVILVYLQCYISTGILCFMQYIILLNVWYILTRNVHVLACFIGESRRRVFSGVLPFPKTADGNEFVFRKTNIIKIVSKCKSRTVFQDNTWRVCLLFGCWIWPPVDVHVFIFYMIYLNLLPTSIPNMTPPKKYIHCIRHWAYRMWPLPCNTIIIMLWKLCPWKWCNWWQLMYIMWCFVYVLLLFVLNKCSEITGRKLLQCSRWLVCHHCEACSISVRNLIPKCCERDFSAVPR